jgi:WD40 repeat protein
MALAFSEDGTLLASGSGDATVRLWNPATGEELHVLRGHDGLVEDVALSPDGSVLASASRDGTVRLWDTATGDLLHTIFSDEPSGFHSWMTGVTFNNSGSLLAVGGADYALRVFAIPTN